LAHLHRRGGRAHVSIREYRGRPGLLEENILLAGEIPEAMRIIIALLTAAGGLMAQLVERPLVTGRQAMVTSLEPLASMAGMKILQQGGNAFDAAVAAALAVTVVDPR